MKKRAFLALALMASLLLGGCGGNTAQGQAGQEQQPAGRGHRHAPCGDHD